MKTIADGNVAAAFGFVCIAGACTTIGASVVFFPSLVKRASRRVLASTLGLSAGVMIFVSFVEIFPQSIDYLGDAGVSGNRGYIYATLSLFGGIFVWMIIDLCIKRLTRDRRPPIHREQADDVDIEIVWNVNEEEEAEPCVTKAEQQQQYLSHYCMGCTDDPVGDLEGWHELAELELRGGGDPTVPTEISIGGGGPPTDEESGNNRIETHETSKEESSGKADDLGNHRSQKGEGERSSDGPQPIRVIVENIPRPQRGDGHFRAPTPSRVHPDEEKRKLAKASYCTALAILLHNFPEGLVAFVAALDNPHVGAVLAISIGIHNIPEGLCVTLPIYYATGNRWKAFRWGCFAGISEPIAALLGWMVLARVITDTAFAVIFGLVSGLMLMISFKELIPTAYRYDPEDSVVTTSIVVGMAIMALSLMLKA